MKKFSKIIEKKSKEDIMDKDSIMDFDGSGDNEDLSSDIINLDKDISDKIDDTKLDGEWEIQSIVNISLEPPTEEELNEAIIINAELGNNPIKRGDFIYITALINKKGNYVHQSQMGVVKVRVVEIYNTLLVLNQLR